MKTFREKLLAIVDKTANQACDMIEGFNSLIDDIDWDNHFNAASEFMRERKETLTSKANDLLREFSDLVKQVKDNLKDFSVTVPFDENCGETLTYTVDGNDILTIEVSYKDETTTRTNKTEVKIPQNCDLEKISKSVNKIAKTATITIPKVVIEPTEEEKKTVKSNAAKPRKKTTKKVVETSEAEETTKTKISSKLAAKLKQNVEKAKLQRDSNGRFVRKVTQ